MSDGSTAPTGHQQRAAARWVIFLGATAFVVYFCLLIVRPFLGVIASSSVLAITFFPVHQRLARVTGRVSLSAFICSVLVVGVILIPLFFLTGLAIDQLLALRDYLQQTFKSGFDPSAVEPLRRAYEGVTRLLGLDATEILNWIGEHASEIGSLTAQYSLSIAANVTNLVVSFVFMIFATFLLFRDGARIVRRIPDLLPFERVRSEAMLARIQDVIHASVYGVLVIAFLQGTLCALMFWILGIPSAALWGMVTVLTSVFPMFGAAAVWVPGTVYLLATGQWPKAIVLAVWGTVMISGIDNFLRPKLVGGRIGLSELVVFFALLGGLQVFGILGIVLGPVLFAIAASVLDVLSDAETRPGMDGVDPARVPARGDSVTHADR